MDLNLNDEIQNQEDLLKVAQGLKALGEKYPNNKMMNEMIMSWTRVVLYTNMVEKNNMELHIAIMQGKQDLVSKIGKFINQWK